MSEPSNDMTPEQSQAARALLKWSQVRLAAKSNVSEGTIRDFESGRRRLRPARVAAIRRALELAGVLFTEPNLSLHDSRIPLVALSNEKLGVAHQSAVLRGYHRHCSNNGSRCRFRSANKKPADRGRRADAGVAWLRKLATRAAGCLGTSGHLHCSP